MCCCGKSCTARTSRSRLFKHLYALCACFRAEPEGCVEESRASSEAWQSVIHQFLVDESDDHVSSNVCWTSRSERSKRLGKRGYAMEQRAFALRIKRCSRYCEERRYLLIFCLRGNSGVLCPIFRHSRGTPKRSNLVDASLRLPYLCKETTSRRLRV